MKYLSLCIIFSFLLSAPRLLVLYPDSDLSNTQKLNATDIETIYFLFMDGFKQYSKSDIIETNDTHMCYSKECAIDVGAQYSADNIVTSKIRVLGSKIIFTGMIFDKNGDNEFTSRITAVNVEDMENAAMRLSKSLVNRDTIDDVADIDNIVESDAEEDARRKSNYKVGIYTGYLIPFGGNGYSYIDDQNTENIGDDKEVKYNSIFQVGLSNYWEFKNNKALLLDGYLSFPVGLGLDLSYNKFINREDFSPFYGAGIGWRFHDNTNLDDFHDNDTQVKWGIAPSVNAGAVFFRTYDTNVIFRLNYHALFSDKGDIDHGLTLNLALTRKLTPNQRMGYPSNHEIVVNRYPVLEILIDILRNK